MGPQIPTMCRPFWRPKKGTFSIGSARQNPLSTLDQALSIWAKWPKTGVNAHRGQIVGPFPTIFGPKRSPFEECSGKVPRFDPLARLLPFWAIWAPKVCILGIPQGGSWRTLPIEKVPFLDLQIDQHFALFLTPFLDPVLDPFWPVWPQGPLGGPGKPLSRL